MQLTENVLGIRPQRLDGRWMVGSVLLHLVIVALLLIRWPLSPMPHSRPTPLMVTILDPDAVRDMPVGPTTHLPPKPKNLDPRPRGPEALPQVRPSVGSPAQGTHVMPAERPEFGRSNGATQAERSTAAVPLTPQLMPTAPMNPSKDLSPQGPEAHTTPGAAEQPGEPGGGGGLPFVSRDEINRLAKLFTEQSDPPKEPYAANIDDLLYLSYISQIARTLELVWKYPHEAGERGQQGVTVLKVTILEDGTLHDAELVHTSGYALLDNEALRAVKRIAPYPPLPPVWHRSKWDLTISFTYYINRVVVGVI